MSVDVSDVLDTINNIDRPGKAFSVGDYSSSKVFANEGFEDKHGKRFPQAGVEFSAGVGHARAEWSVFDAEAKGPNAIAGAKITPIKATAYAKAELCSASAAAGPMKATVGLSADTGVGVGLGYAEVKFLGTGFSIGQRTSISLFGTGFEINLW